MNTQKIKGLLYSTIILGAITLTSVDTYASEIDQEPVTPAIEYIAPEPTEPAPVINEVHSIEETQELALEQEVLEPIVEPEVLEPITEPVQETPILSEAVEENQEPGIEPEPVKEIEEEKIIEPTPAPIVKESEQPIVEQKSEEDKDLVQPNPEKVISQPKLNISEIGGAGSYQIKAVGTGKIVIFVGRKTVIENGIEGEISGIYSIMVKDGKIDEQYLYLLSLADDSYLYGTGNVTFEISSVQEPIVEPETPIKEEKEETPAPNPEKPVEQEKPAVEPKDDEKEVRAPTENVKGKYVGFYQSNSELGRVAGVYFDKDTNMLNFEAFEYYLNHKSELPASIKIVKNQGRVKILDVMYQLKWQNGELVGMEAEDQSYSSQDDEINEKLEKYPVFSNSDRNDYDAKSLEKYEYVNIDDENLVEDNLNYTAEKMGFYYVQNVKLS